jgi:hypothetical protein
MFSEATRPVTPVTRRVTGCRLFPNIHYALYNGNGQLNLILYLFGMVSTTSYDYSNKNLERLLSLSRKSLLPVITRYYSNLNMSESQIAVYPIF